MRYRLLTCLLCLPAALFGQLDTTSVLARASRFDGSVARSTDVFYVASPAAMLYRCDQPLSQLAVRLDLRREDEALLQPLGDGVLEGSFRADSHLPLDPRTVLWADVRYVRGRSSRVRWNSTADYLLLYPHVVADSLGGDLSTEEYAFGGGWAHRFGRLDLGIRADYRARQEFRQVDPRPHNVVSDFSLSLGAGMELPQYVLAVDLAGRLYKQNQDIDFYDPRGANTAEKFMTGLGSYYARYSGKSQQLRVAYEGKGYDAGVQLVPRKGQGFYARAGYGNFRSDRLYLPNNSIPVSRLLVRLADAAAAYRSAGWSLRAEGGCEWRRGIEMIADRNGQGRIVDEQATYRNRLLRAEAEATVEWRYGATKYTLQPRVGWWRSEAEYIYPSRRMILSQCGAALRAGAQWRGPKWRVTAAAGAGYYVSPGNRLSFSGDTSQPGVSEYIWEYLVYTAERLSEGVWAPELAMRGERSLQRGLACFAEVRWEPRLYAGGLSEHNVTVACGIIF